MKKFLPPLRALRFYAVVPDVAWVARMIEAGADTVQLRQKNLHGTARLAAVRECVRMAEGSGCQLFVNDYWREALECGAYGVHLGQEDLAEADVDAIRAAGLRLGVSTHSEAELECALALAPSYVACGAVFATTTKVMPTAPQGLAKLRAYVHQAGSTPTVAIGGITLDNARAVLDTGVSSLAVVRAVTEAANPSAVVRAFQALWLPSPA